MLSHALEYLTKYKFSIIPVGKDKKPLVKWEEFQKRQPTEEEINAWWQKHPEANIGVVTGVISNLAVVDIDTEEGKEAIQEYIPDTIITPTVETPRGGQHLYFQCPDSKLSNNSRLIPGCDLRANGGFVVAPPSVNGKGNAYSWTVGLENAVAILPDKYLHCISSILSFSSSSYRMLQNNEGGNVTKCNKLFNLGTRNNDLFHIANQLTKSNTSVEVMSEVLEILARNCNPPFPEKEIKIIVESALKRAEKKGLNIAQEVRDWITVLQGCYMRVTDCYNELQVVTKEQKTAVRVNFSRLVKEGILAKAKGIGCYRVIDKDAKKLNFIAKTEDALDLKWPFDIEDYIKIYPKSIIVVAGVPNAGKTALLLNFIEMNMFNHEINYFSSEMGNTELKERLLKFERSIDSWKFQAFERASDFSDLISPDAINVIDYIEIYEEHYKIGLYIKEIFDKLDKGIAIIALQKKPGSSYGVGGIASLEKARLYLTMDSHALKIEKGKNWTDAGINPNGLILNYKLVQGCHFIVDKDWHKEGEYEDRADDEKITFDAIAGEFLNITEKKMKFYKDKFPRIDVEGEIGKMEAWLMANTSKRKKNYERFITNWLS